jgi:N-acetylneuraminate lyase
MKRDFWIEGIVPAVFTPMEPDGSLNLEMVAPIVEQLIADNATALYVCGSTGEGPSLTSEERMSVASKYVEMAAGRIPVIVQVGHNSLYKARELAAHAQEIGADAISAVPPMYFKPKSVDILLACLAEITSGAPNLPFYYYHIPSKAGVEINVVDFLRKSPEHIPSLAGVKYSTFTLFEFQACLELDRGRYNMLFGSDEMLLAGLATGAKGAIGTTYCFATPLYRKVIKAFERGNMDEARYFQSCSVKLVETLGRYDIRAAFKGMMSVIGLDCGPQRLPQLSLSKQELVSLKNDMENIGFFDWGRNLA